MAEEMNLEQIEDRATAVALAVVNQKLDNITEKIDKMSFGQRIGDLENDMAVLKQSSAVHSKIFWFLGSGVIGAILTSILTIILK